MSSRYSRVESGHKKTERKEITYERKEIKTYRTHHHNDDVKRKKSRFHIQIF